MGLFSRRHRGSQSESPTPLYQVPVAFGSSLTFRCDCGRGMYPSAVTNGTETSKTIQMTCGGCKRTLDVTLDAGYAIEAVTRPVGTPDKDPMETAWANVAAIAERRPPAPLTARQVISAVLADLDDLLDEKYVRGLVDNILLGLDANGLSIVQSSEVE